MTQTCRSEILREPSLKMIEKIGEGGMSEVWKAWDTIKQRLVAVKILREEFSRSGDDIGAFRAEERMMEELHVPGVVAAYDFNFGNGKWYMVMEYVQGYSTDVLLERKGTVSEDDCLIICESLAQTLDRVWNDYGIVHCDIKPDNIMINTDGTVKLTDMGISQRFGLTVGGRSDKILGTPAYISPEQVFGGVSLDCRADIYLLGATLYHLASGEVLFPELDAEGMLDAHCDRNCRAKDPRLNNPWLSEGFVRLLEAMLVKERDGRLQSWREVLAYCLEVERHELRPRRPEGAPSSSVELLPPS